jgi:transposase-like protein
MESIPKCPKCNSEGFEFDVSSKGRILYRCKNPKCRYRYNSLSGTKLRRSELSDETIKLLYDLIYGTSIPIAEIATQTQINKHTVRRYRRLWDAEQKEGLSNAQVSMPKF